MMARGGGGVVERYDFLPKTIPSLFWTFFYGAGEAGLSLLTVIRRA